MKKKKEVLLDELSVKLVDVEREIVLIERNYDNITGKVNFMEQRPYVMPDMYGMDTASRDFEYTSFASAMTDTDYVDEKLEYLKLEREDLRSQIKTLEKEIEQAQRGA